MRFITIMIALTVLVGCTQDLGKCFDIPDEKDFGIEMYDSKVCIDKKEMKATMVANIRVDREMFDISDSDHDRFVEAMACTATEAEETMTKKSFLKSAPKEVSDELEAYMTDIQDDAELLTNVKIQGHDINDCDVDKAKESIEDILSDLMFPDIDSKTKEMAEQQKLEKILQAKADLDIYCESLCTKAKTMKDKVNYCISYYRQELDVNGNYMIDYTDALGLEGYCEDRIYCASYKPCQGSLNMRNCKKLVCDYFKTEFDIKLDLDLADKLVGYDIYTNTYDGWFQPGSCWNDLTEEQQKMHWFTYFMKVPDLNDVDESGNHLGGACFLKEGTCLSTYTQVLDEFDGFSSEEWEDACPPVGIV